MKEQERQFLLFFTTIAYSARPRAEQHSLVELSRHFTVFYVHWCSRSLLRQLVRFFVPVRPNDKEPTLATGIPSGIIAIPYYSPIPFDRVSRIHALNRHIFFALVSGIASVVQFFRQSAMFVIWLTHVDFYEFLAWWRKGIIIIDTLDHMGNHHDAHGEFMKNYRSTGMIIHDRALPEASPKLHVIPWGHTHEDRLRETLRYILQLPSLFRS